MSDAVRGRIVEHFGLESLRGAKVEIVGEEDGDAEDYAGLQVKLLETRGAWKAGEIIKIASYELRVDE